MHGPFHLAVNGTLMRGLELNPNLLEFGAVFVREDHTVPAYRLYSIGDRHPGMVRLAEGGVAVAVEVWAVPRAGVAGILLKEPPGLSIGKVQLVSGNEVLGVLPEPVLCAGQREISAARQLARLHCIYRQSAGGRIARRRNRTWPMRKSNGLRACLRPAPVFSQHVTL